MTARVFGVCVLTAIFSASALADDNDSIQLIYPMSAADTELDNSTPAKRVTPPIREESEYDPITPIGQIKAIVDTLTRLEAQSDALVETVGKLQIDDKGILPILERSSRNQDAIGTNVETILESSKGVAAKIDAIQKTTENLRASVEAVQKTAASVERIRTSRWTDAAVVAILALVLIQLVWKVGAVVVDGVKRRAAQYQEFAAFIREKQQAENAKQ